MKKQLCILFASIIFLAACSGTAAHLSDEQVQKYKEIIQESSLLLKDENLSEGARIEALTESGFAHDSLGKENKAIKLYEDVLDIEPTHFVALNNLTVIYEDRGDIEQARYYVGELYTYHGADSAVLKDTIRILCKTEEFDKALNVLTEFTISVENDSKYTQFISDQFGFIGRMSAAAESTSEE